MFVSIRVMFLTGKVILKYEVLKKMLETTKIAAAHFAVLWPINGHID